ncbi:unnamed protein product [Closterium sp. NIES-54]
MHQSGAAEVAAEDDVVIIMAPQNAVGNCILDVSDITAGMSDIGSNGNTNQSPQVDALPEGHSTRRSPRHAARHSPIHLPPHALTCVPIPCALRSGSASHGGGSSTTPCHHPQPAPQGHPY